MKTLVLLLIVSLLAASSAPLRAQDDNPRSLRLGYFSTNAFAEDVEGSDLRATGVEIAVDVVLSETPRSQELVTLEYAYATVENEWGVEVTDTLIALFYGQKVGNPENRFYLGWGIGLIQMDVEVGPFSGSKTDLSGRVLAGFRLGAYADSPFLEAEYKTGGRNGNTGWSLGLGFHF